MRPIVLVAQMYPAPLGNRRPDTAFANQLVAQALVLESHRSLARDAQGHSDKRHTIYRELDF